MSATYATTAPTGSLTRTGLGAAAIASVATTVVAAAIVIPAVARRLRNS